MLPFLARLDLDAIAHGERVRKRSHGAVDLGAHAMVTDLGMYRVGKVERSGSHAQVHDLALGGEDEDLLVVEVDLERVEKLLGIVNLVVGRPVEAALEGVDLVVEALGARCLDRTRTTRALIEPVRGDAVFGLLVHLVRADLNLKRARRGTDDRGVKALVVIRLGHVDIVFKAPRHGRPQRVDGAEGGIAVRNRVGDDAQGHQIVDLGELLTLALHLLIDRPIMLRATGDLIPGETHTP